MLYDVPCTSETETVEAIGVMETGRWLATNRAIYEAPLSANFATEPGETLPAGTILTDAIQPMRGHTLPAGVPLVMERRFLGHAYQAGLIFPNEEVPLTIGRDNPYPTFRIVGREEDVRLFWRSFHDRTEDRSLLARAGSGGFLNPARFLFEQVLYPRVQFYLIYLDKTGPHRLPNINTRLFRGLLPPGVLFSLLVVAPHQSLPLDPLHLTCSRERSYHTAPRTRLTLSLQANHFTRKTC